MNPKSSDKSASGSIGLKICLLLVVAGVVIYFFSGRSTAPQSSSNNTAGDTPAPEELFMQSMNRGKSAFEKGEGQNAIAEFKRALELTPSHPDAKLNLANAFLLASDTTNAVRAAQEVLKTLPQSPAAHFIIGCALLRMSQYEAALKELQIANDLEPNVAAVSFHLGRAHYELAHFPEASRAYQEAIAAEPDHPAAHYALSQTLVRLNQTEAANQSLELHKQIQAKRTGPPADVATYERCKHTAIRLPFRLEQPDVKSPPLLYSDITPQSFQGKAAELFGPIGVIDINHRGANDLFLRTREGFQVWFNSNGTFHPHPAKLQANPDGAYRQCLIADLQNDRYEDVIVLGEKASHVFKFATNGTASDVTAFCGLKSLTAKAGGLVDLDFTGKLDLITSSPDGTQIRIHKNLGNLLFRDQSTNSGMPASFQGTSQFLIDDLNDDDIMDLVVGEPGKIPTWFAKQRGGKLVATNSPSGWPISSVFEVADLDNDLHNDFVGVVGTQIRFAASSNPKLPPIELNGFLPKSIKSVDLDNDGWLDLLAVGKGIRAWRNAGKAGFQDISKSAGLDRHDGVEIEQVIPADYDSDGSPDLLLAQATGGLQLLRSQGISENKRIKVRLFGNRSNASGLGIKLELVGGGWRSVRTIRSLPIEVGVGKREQLDSVTVRWFDLAVPEVEVKIDSTKTTVFFETILPTGSCPYLYAWNGKSYEFVTDLLGAAPLGLPVAPGKYITADTDEVVWIGNDQSFPTRNGYYSIQITEELREVLYLDEAKLWVVDRPKQIELVPTSKLMPGPPFPKANIAPVHQRVPLRSARNFEGMDITATLQNVDRDYASPTKLRAPQVRGLAELHGAILDFGPLDPSQPLVLALNGWLRFGGGMANISASLEEDLPYPFPTLEAETTDGNWKKVDVTVGAPAGKTKEIMVSLQGKLPANTKRLKLSAGFEIHWDRIALFNAAAVDQVRITQLKPARSDLHWRGFSPFKTLPWNQPQTPDYAQVLGAPKWRITPEGWCTTYGPVDPLLERKDNSLVLLNGGDELTLDFAASELPPLQEGFRRDYYLFTVGWDKDADFHVSTGWTVGPLPYHGQNDQAYGKVIHPEIENAPWARQFNRRYVGSLTLDRPPRKQDKQNHNN